MEGICARSTALLSEVIPREKNFNFHFLCTLDESTAISFHYKDLISFHKKNTHDCRPKILRIRRLGETTSTTRDFTRNRDFLFVAGGIEIVLWSRLACYVSRTFRSDWAICYIVTDPFICANLPEFLSFYGRTNLVICTPVITQDDVKYVIFLLEKYPSALLHGKVCGEKEIYLCARVW